MLGYVTHHPIIRKNVRQISSIKLIHFVTGGKYPLTQVVHLNSINIHVRSTMKVCDFCYGCDKSISLCLHMHHWGDMHCISEALQTLCCGRLVITLVKHHTESSHHGGPANLNHKSQDCRIRCSIEHRPKSPIKIKIQNEHGKDITSSTFSTRLTLIFHFLL